MPPVVEMRGAGHAKRNRHPLHVEAARIAPSSAPPLPRHSCHDVRLCPRRSSVFLSFVPLWKPSCRRMAASPVAGPVTPLAEVRPGWWRGLPWAWRDQTTGEFGVLRLQKPSFSPDINDYRDFW